MKDVPVYCKLDWDTNSFHTGHWTATR